MGSEVFRKYALLSVDTVRRERVMVSFSCFVVTASSWELPRYSGY